MSDLRQATIDRICREGLAAKDHGEIADYIPELANVPLSSFAIAISQVDGTEITWGDANTSFSIQSVSKVFALALALGRSGAQIWKRVGKEPSGRAFNSIADLEKDSGRPRNPFINAGALVVTDEILTGRTTGQALAEVLSFIRAAADDNNIFIDKRVARSEMKNGHRNIALANFIRALGNLKMHPDTVAWTYFNQCAIEMTVRQLARSGRFLAFTDAQPALISSENIRGILALMTTCGHYDGSGNFAFRVGLPAKSGVGGGILAIVPGKASIAVWSPGLDVYGNSLIGTRTLEILAKNMNWSMFQSSNRQFDGGNLYDS